MFYGISTIHLTRRGFPLGYSGLEYFSSSGVDILKKRDGRLLLGETIGTNKLPGAQIEKRKRGGCSKALVHTPAKAKKRLADEEE